MNAITKRHTETSTFETQFGLVGLTESVRGLTKTLIAAVPRIPSIASLRADVMSGKKEPVKHLLRLAYAAIDAGVPVARVVQWAKDFIALVEQYAARRERRQSAGVLPFPEVLTRVAVTAEREDSEADCARMQIKQGCVASLEKARSERLQAIGAFEREVEVITAEIARLRTGE